MLVVYDSEFLEQEHVFSIHFQVVYIRKCWLEKSPLTLVERLAF